MNNFLDDLKRYFATTPINEIQAAWEKTSEYDKIGPKIEELFHFKKQDRYIIRTQEEHEFCRIIFNGKNPKFSSGFLMPLS